MAWGVSAREAVAPVGNKIVPRIVVLMQGDAG